MLYIDGRCYRWSYVPGGGGKLLLVLDTVVTVGPPDWWTRVRPLWACLQMMMTTTVTMIANMMTPATTPPIKDPLQQNQVTTKHY